MTNTQKPELPLLAPSRKLKLSAPFNWLKLGLNDLFTAPAVSLSYGVMMAAMVLSIGWFGWQYGSAWIMVGLLCGIVFIAPLIFIGTYAISAQIERKQQVEFKRTLKAGFKRYIGNELVFTLILLMIFLVWARAASVASIFLPSNDDLSLTQLWPYLLTIGSVGALFLAICFSVSVFGLPMIMHRDVDAITAVITSINAVLRNKLVMFFWALTIAALVIVGAASLGIGLIIVLPIIGHAVWHSYLDAIDASDFPLHSVGITSSRRSASEAKLSE